MLLQSSKDHHELRAAGVQHPLGGGKVSSWAFPKGGTVAGFGSSASMLDTGRPNRVGTSRETGIGQLATVRGRILVLLSTPEAGLKLAGQLNLGGLVSAQPAPDVTEAIEMLRRETFDMLIAGTDLRRPPVAAFLAKAREMLPRTLRVLYEETPFDGNLGETLSTVGPCGLFSGSPDPARLVAVIGAQRKRFADFLPGGPPTAALPWIRRASDVDANSARSHRKVKPSAAPARPPDLMSESVSTEVMKGAGMDGNGLREPEISVLTPTQNSRMLDIIAKLEALLEKPNIRLPVLPTIAMDVRKIVADEKADYETIAGKVGLDSGMSARLLQVANSPLYATTQPARNLQSAISRIGMLETCSILQALMAESMFRPADGRFTSLMNQLWVHSLAVAYGNQILAQTLHIPESQDFFMMGLLHDIGKLLILYLLEQLPTSGLAGRTDVTDEVVLAIFTSRHNSLGQRLMRKWAFAKPFRSVAAYHDDVDQVPQGDEAVVVTYFSNLLTHTIGLSLRAQDENQLNDKEIGEALNMTQDSRAEIIRTVTDLMAKITQTYCRG